MEYAAHTIIPNNIMKTQYMLGIARRSFYKNTDNRMTIFIKLEQLNILFKTSGSNAWFSQAKLKFDFGLAI